MSFLGPKPNQDPMNNVFEQKKSLGKIFFRDPPGPPTEKNFGPGPGRPGRAGGGPKGGQSRSVGVSNPSKTIKTPHGTCEMWGRPARNSSSSQSYDQNTFFWPPLGFLACFGGRLAPSRMVIGSRPISTISKISTFSTGPKISTILDYLECRVFGVFCV